MYVCIELCYLLFFIWGNILSYDMYLLFRQLKIAETDILPCLESTFLSHDLHYSYKLYVNVDHVAV